MGSFFSPPSSPKHLNDHNLGQTKPSDRLILLLLPLVLFFNEQITNFHSCPPTGSLKDIILGPGGECSEEGGAVRCKPASLSAV